MSLARSRCVLCCALALSALANSALAQSDAADDQIISDPELGDEPESSTDLSSESGAIEDPELDGATSGEAPATTGPSEPSGDSSATSGHTRLVLHSRFGIDLFRADPREEIYESTTVGLLEANLRRSESLRFVLGLRMRYQVNSFAHDTADTGALRYALDVAPTAGYADAKLGDGVHLQVGYQTVQLGRFDVLSATDVLSVHDQRDGPAGLPEGAELAQLAVRLDYDANSWLSLRAVYVPFFTPHIVSVLESDYALFRQRQQDVESTLGALGLLNAFSANLSRSDRALIAETGLAVFTPTPTLSDPQGALRLTMHGLAGEIGLTVATALEHSPAFRVSQELIDAALDPMSPDVAQRLADQLRPIRVEYNRFAVFGADAAIDIAPLSLGIEVAYMLHRTFYTLGRGEFPLSLPLPDTTDLLHLGVRLEYVQGTTWVVALEAFGVYAVSEPSDPQRAWLFFLDGRYSAGAGLVFGWAPEFGLRAQLGGVVLTGPSLFLAPRLGYMLLDELEIEVGAVIVEGKTPPAVATPELTIGTLYDSVDQVFVGLRYIP